MKFETSKKMIADLGAYIKRVEKGNGNIIETFEIECGEDVISCVVHKMDKRTYANKRSQMVGGNVPTGIDLVKEWCKMIYAISISSTNGKEQGETVPQVVTVTTPKATTRELPNDFYSIGEVKE